MSFDRTAGGLVGKSVPEPDSFEKVVGTTRYSDDVTMPGMLWGRALRSPYANARIRKLDVSPARKLPGVHAVLTAADVPGVNLWGNFPGDRDDHPVLVEKHARAVGDPIALVAAATLEITEEALSRIKIEYEAFPPLEDPLDSLKPDVPLIDERGNVTAHLGYSR